jgi:hypothetical protein
LLIIPMSFHTLRRCSSATTSPSTEGERRQQQRIFKRPYKDPGNNWYKRQPIDGRQPAPDNDRDH